MSEDPGLQRLWTPWRMEYIKSAADEAPADCIFCELPGVGDDEETYILARGEHGFVILNKYPYNPGHLMVAPFRHVGQPDDLTDEELFGTTTLLRRTVGALRDAAAPHGFNIGMNVGRVAGAGIPDHVHWHVVPRWGGDHNFMPVIGQTKVLPELLAETYAKLRSHFGG